MLLYAFVETQTVHEKGLILLHVNYTSHKKKVIYQYTILINTFKGIKKTNKARLTRR